MAPPHSYQLKTDGFESMGKMGHGVKMAQQGEFEKLPTWGSHPDILEFAYFDLYFKSSFKVSFSRETLS